MPRYYNNRSYRPYKKAKRPTERIIRAAQTTVASGTTTTGYVWTCDTPSTVCQIKLDAGIYIVTGKQIGRASCRERVSSPV